MREKGGRLAAVALLVSLVLTGCGGPEDPDAEKRGYYEILDARGAVVETVADPERLAELDELLNSFTEGEGTFLEGAVPAALYTYVYYQEKTLRAGEDPAAEKTYWEVLRLTVPAEGDTVVLQVLAAGTAALAEAVPQLDLSDLLTFSYTPSAQTLEALRDPGRFAAE